MAASRPRTSSLSTPAGGEPSFTELGLPELLVDALASLDITTAFPIQAATIPHSLAGRDVLGRGRTGSGKTYAFLLPLAARLAGLESQSRAGRPRGLILAPTRELATQIQTALAPLAASLSLRTLTVFGGVPAGRQIRALRQGCDIVIACPGRLTDLIQAGHARLDAVEVTVLDEADHMADLGFLPVVRRLMDQTPAGGQRLLFSATLDGDVDVLVQRFLTDPVVHSIDSAASPVPTMAHHVLQVDTEARLPVIIDLAAAPGRTVVFTRTKSGAKALTRKLNMRGVDAVELHGNLSQSTRSRNLGRFATGEATTLVATDIAARGIHIDDVTLVIHADPPVEHKAYLHRSGRTGRAGARGTVVTITLDHQRAEVRALTRRAGVTPVTTRVHTSHPMLKTIAPGDRRLGAPVMPAGGTTPTGSHARPGSRHRPEPGTSTPVASTAAGARETTRGRRRNRRRPGPSSAAGRHSAAGFSAGRPIR